MSNPFYKPKFFMETPMENETKDQMLTIKWLLAMTIADIDIFLLQNESQTGDNEKVFFTREEIRDQLTKTIKKVTDVLILYGIDINEPFSSDFIHL